MIKQIGLIKKNPALTDEEFYREWGEVHGPLAAKSIPGLRRYVQNWPIKMPNLLYEYDGIAELYFDDVDAYNRFLEWRLTEAGAELTAHTKKLIDEQSWVRYIVEEHVVKER